MSDVIDMERFREKRNRSQEPAGKQVENTVDMQKFQIQQNLQNLTTQLNLFVSQSTVGIIIQDIERRIALWDTERQIQTLNTFYKIIQELPRDENEKFNNLTIQTAIRVCF
jgi:hypothetical protein